MRKLFVLLFSFFALAFIEANASDNWEILVNNKVIFRGADTQTNFSVFLDRMKCKKTDCLSIKYDMDEADKKWNRTFYIDDSSGQNIKTLNLNEQKGSVSVNTSVLKEMMDKHTVFIYTVSLPKDRALAAAVRVRRILLCKIEWN